VAVHYRVAVRHAGREARGTTENLSERGAMLSVEIDPPLAAGDPLALALSLPDGTVIGFGGRVCWVSSVLPGMAGIEFDLPMPEVLVGHIRELLEGRLLPASVG